MVQREELAAFLRDRRARVQPEDVGLPGGARRATPGLRREEVALLSGMSADYYTRLEQARGPHPSAQVLSALARGLRLSLDERDYLFRLAGQAAPDRLPTTGHVGAGLLHLLDRLTDTPALVLSDLGEVLAQNPLAAALLGDASGLTGLDRYQVWRWFTSPQARAIYPADEHEHHSQAQVADLRAAAARRGEDPTVTRLVRRLTATSREFAELWARHDVRVRRTDRKRIVHPAVGIISVDCEWLQTPEQDQRLLVLSPQPGTDAAERLALLRVIGLQDLAARAPPDVCAWSAVAEVIPSAPESSAPTAPPAQLGSSLDRRLTQ